MSHRSLSAHGRAPTGQSIGARADIVQLFQYLTGRSLAPKFEKLLVVPWNMRDRFIELIRREVEHHKAGRPARIVAKMNPDSAVNPNELEARYNPGAAKASDSEVSTSF
ncbi:MAG TPA: hypothetical protein VLX11_04640 [Candidatus Acidoferrales bacterium]|nr:hypothetical protein [Candidatus Acidoferrales bacterium]